MEDEMLEIAELRALTGLSQSQFGEKFHIGLSTLRKWEQGKNRTPDYYKYALTELLKYQGVFYGELKGKQ